MDSLADWVNDARARTLALVTDLSDEQWLGPRLSTVNPLRWELGHLAWFAEHWVLRHARGRPPLLDGADALYDSARVAHDTRWDLPLPSREATLGYLERVREQVLALLDSAGSSDGSDDSLVYFVKLAVFHEDMHAEAFLYTRQTHGWPAPPIAPSGSIASSDPVAPTDGGPLPGDAEHAGGTFLVGAPHDARGRGERFVFDNEKWAHPVDLRPFRIARAAVTQSELAEFVEAGGYRDARWWSRSGNAWRVSVAAEHPLYWRRDGARWLRRDFDRWVPLEPHRPALHVCLHEAEAYCRWKGRRLPTEAEWEVAAAGARSDGAQLDLRALGACDVGARASTDSAIGCRQMVGNVWEWTSSTFRPYPGFVVDPYAEYSKPWMEGGHHVLRGGAFMTRTRLLRPTWRNFYPPDRRDVWAGFRTAEDA